MAKTYDREFYDEVDCNTRASAQQLVPLVMQIVRPCSVIDVGCGRGGWLAVFLEHGVSRIKGVDAKYVDPSSLLIDRSDFQELDLSRPFSLDGAFDLAVCLEVAEHLPASMAHALVGELTKCAPVVMFSAAVPGQGGTRHVNEQWHDYWHLLFNARDYDAYDVLRPQLWGRRNVAPWYRQNTFIYAARGAAKSQAIAALDAEFDHALVPIAPYILRQYTSVTSLIRVLPRDVLRAIKKRLK